MNDFTIRAYSKKELALLYFPDSTPDTAVSHLMALIRRCDMLMDELRSLGYQPRNKTFSPLQVRAISGFLGEP